MQKSKRNRQRGDARFMRHLGNVWVDGTVGDCCGEEMKREDVKVDADFMGFEWTRTW
jgi:hypothetical protein